MIEALVHHDRALCQRVKLSQVRNVGCDLISMILGQGLLTYLSSLELICLYEDDDRDFVDEGFVEKKDRDKGGVLFLKAVNCDKEYKDKFYLATLIKDAISEVRVKNVVQVITENALVCKATGSLVETEHPHIIWTPCVVYTLNLALKNICATKNTEKNEFTYDALCWINNVEPIYDMLRIMYTDKPTLHLVYEMWDEMIEKVKKSIYRHKGKKGDERSIFYEVVYDILIDLWTRSSTPLHCDVFDSFEEVGILGVASLSLDDLDMEMVIFSNKEEDMESVNAMN
ncbi:hypothetical protein J1N35_011191 [Gossypium stocksii]|uniref:DUF659 domain-containing protein n=1 Tax=Gossypium stocksii TaxID=47602 RepID=A0A9D3W313_9ROSI|nr:hypothetical protein J1N35_011191 [Gossypium stocksii]